MCIRDSPHVGVSIPAMISGTPVPAGVRTGAAMLDDHGWRANLDIDALREGHAGDAEECCSSNEKQFLFHRCGSSFRGKIWGPVRGEILIAAAQPMEPDLG